jgi:hypothetical protein
LSGKRNQKLISQVRAWAKGNPVISPLPELSLFATCKANNCLPDAGGWYDQSPEVCEMFTIFNSIVSEEEAKKNKK